MIDEQASYDVDEREAEWLPVARILTFLAIAGAVLSAAMAIANHYFTGSFWI